VPSRSLSSLLVVLFLTATAAAQTTPETQGTGEASGGWGATAGTETVSTSAPDTSTSPPPAGVSDAPMTEAAATGSGGVDFLLSARLVAPWILFGGDEDFLAMALITPTALPRFVAGAQIGKLGVGAGFNYGHVGMSSETEGDEGPSTSMGMFLFGPTVSYQLLESASKRVQLHVQAAFMIGTGGATVEEEGEDDVETGLFTFGFDAGLLGRAMIIDGFALDGGISFDLISVETSMDAVDASQTSTLLEFLGYLGVTFLI